MGFFFWGLKMNDRDLLELAAKAAGMDIDPERYDDAWGVAPRRTATWWNPLIDDGDALRLAAKLRLGIEFNDASVVASWVDDGYESKNIYGYPDKTQDDDFNIVYTNHDKAARRAIVRAAAEIGKGIQLQTAEGVLEDNYYKSQAEAEELGRQMQEGGSA